MDIPHETRKGKPGPGVPGSKKWATTTTTKKHFREERRQGAVSYMSISLFAPGMFHCVTEFTYKTKIPKPNYYSFPNGNHSASYSKHKALLVLRS